MANDQPSHPEQMDVEDEDDGSSVPPTIPKNLPERSVNGTR